MSALGGLVDLSLFATSPTNDRHFAPSNNSPSEGIYRQVPCYRSQRELNHSLPRSFAMKPLPPLPPRGLCKRREMRRHDANSRCILMRLKRAAVDDRQRSEALTLQQRRNVTATPQLTLSVPPRSGREESNPRPSMIWMPEEQMWLTQDRDNQDRDNQDRDNQNNGPCFWAYPPPPPYSGHHYSRSEPSPDSDHHFDLSPRSPVRNQFLSLMESSGQERLSSLFQEAVQTVPMMDLSHHSPRASFAPEQDWPSDTSDYQSYHSANSYPAVRTSLSEEQRIVFPQLAWEDSWEGGGRRPREEPRILFPQIAWEDSWEAVARRVTRPASAMS